VSVDAFMFYESGVIKVDNFPNTMADIEYALALVG